MLRRYKKINNPVFTHGNYSLVPVRDEDKYAILKWRNEQIDILRQEHPLTNEQQEYYFKHVIDPLFEQEKPAQFIFSFLENNVLIGYGGLVHINWENSIAEISFLTETSRNNNKDVFISDWVNYLTLLKQIADGWLNFNSIFTYAYDLRPALYVALELCGFTETNRMRGHVKIQNEFKDVVIHTLFLNALHMSVATENDTDLYFNWANDAEVRKFSFQQDEIKYDNHVSWFHSKIKNPDFKFYIFRNALNEPAGQVRINTGNAETIIGISIDAKHRGLGYGSKMLRMACAGYFKDTHTGEITAYIKTENTASVAIFKKAGFIEKETVLVNTIHTLKLILKNE